MLSICESSFEQLYLLDENAVTEFVSKNWNKIKKKLDNLMSIVPKKLQKMENDLKRNGINVKKIKEAAKSAAKKSKVKNGVFDDLKVSLNQFVTDFKKRKFDDVTNADESLAGKVTLGLVLTAVCFFLTTFFFKAAMFMGLSSMVARTLAVLVSSPLVEETAKLISVKAKATGSFFVIFNIAEFISYFHRYLGVIPIPAIIIARLLAVLMHYTMTRIHIQADKDNQSGTGWLMSVFLHAAWNSLAVLGGALKSVR